MCTGLPQDMAKRQKQEGATSRATRYGGATPQFRFQGLQGSSRPPAAGVTRPWARAGLWEEEVRDGWSDKCPCPLLVPLAL